MNEISSACFLRGVNVSGKNMIRMADLTAIFNELGFTNVSTYLQSGNVIFSYKENLNEVDLENLISCGIRKKLKLDVPVIFRNKAGISEILNNNPFINRDKADREKLYVTMLEEKPETGRTEVLKGTDFTPERFFFSGKNIYLLCPGGYGRAKLNNNFFEKKLAAKATTRNWKTITAIDEMLNLIVKS